MRRLFLILALLCWTPGFLLNVSPAFATFINWDGSESTSWKDGLNWVGDAVPGPADIAGFDDNTSSNSCVVDEAVDVLGITLDNYTGTLDLGDTGEDIQVGTSGFLIDTGTVDMGDADVTITNGDFNYVNCGTFVGGTSTVIMKGTGNLSFKNIEPLYNLTIFLGATTTVPAGSGYNSQVAGALTVNGTISVAADRLALKGTGALSMGSAGSITGNGELWFAVSLSGGGLTTFTDGASIDIANVVVNGPLATAVFVGATWDCGTLFKVIHTADPTRTWSPTGTHTFNCPVQFANTDAAGTLQIDSTNNPSYVFTDNVIWTETAGTLAWTNPGTGTITFSGGNAQGIDLGGQTVEDIVVNKPAGTLIFSSGWTAHSFDAVQGTVDFNGQTVETAGDFTISPGARLGTGGDGLDLADITVGANFKATGSSATDLDMTAAAWSLDVTGGAHCRWVNLTHCDASGGSTVYAQRSIDGGSNQGFLFLVRPRHWPMRLGLPRRRALFRGVGAN